MAILTEIRDELFALLGRVTAMSDDELRAEVLTWYLEFNSAGTPHTEAELNRVRGLLEKEMKP